MNLLPCCCTDAAHQICMLAVDMAAIEAYILPATNTATLQGLQLQRLNFGRSIRNGNIAALHTKPTTHQLQPTVTYRNATSNTATYCWGALLHLHTYMVQILAAALACT
jgi:hypothetical protein